MLNGVLIKRGFFSSEGAFRITKMFMDGDVLFTWNVKNTEGFNVSITKDNAGIYWKHVNNSQYIEKNAWSFKTLEINVHRLNGDQVGRTSYTGNCFRISFYSNL